MRKIGSGKTSYTADQIIRKLWDAFLSFDYDQYYKTKAIADLRNKQISDIVKRIESHPSWNKPRAEHEVIISSIEKQQQKSYDAEMVQDALHGRHHKHANTFFGKILFDPEYRKVCEKLGVTPILSK